MSASETSGAGVRGAEELTASGEARSGPSARHGANVSSNPVHPLVSVCVSAYNVERFLAEALSSVLGQTYQNLEVILFDNGSADRTFDVAQSFSDERLRVTRIPENIGGYQGMNRAISMAHGDLIAVYHSDDVYEPDIVAKEVTFLRSHPQVGAVFTMCHFMDEVGRIYGGLDVPRELARRESLDYDDIYRFFLRHQNTAIACPTFMVRRQVLEAVGPFNPERYDIGADVEMWLRITRQFPIAILDSRLLRYRHSPNQWSQRDRRLRTSRNPFFEIMDEYLEKDQWRERLSRGDLVEYAYHRCDDETTRAANHLIRREAAAARELLNGSYPWRTLFVSFRRRKMRVLLMRCLIMTGLALGANRALGRLLRWTEYGE